MAQDDGAIRIATKITTKDAEESLASLEWQIKKSAKYMDELRSKMDALKETKIPTKEYKDLQEKLSATEKEMSSLVAKQEEWESMGITSEGAWDTLNNKIVNASDRVDMLKEKIQKLSDEGKDFTLGQDTEEYKAYERQLRYEEEAVEKAAEHYKKLSSDEERLAEVKKNSTVSDQKVIELLEERNRLAQRLKDLEKSGVSEGYEEHDKAYVAWKNAADAVKAYRAELDKQTESGQENIALKEARELERKEAIQRRIEEQAERNLQKENARIQKEIENEAKLAEKEAARQAKEESRINALLAKEEAKRAKEIAAIQAQEREEQRLALIRENSVVGNQKIVESINRIKQLEQEIADLKKAGITEGYEDYDNRVKELFALKQEVTEYSGKVEEAKKSYAKLGQAAQRAFSASQPSIRKAADGMKRFGGYVKNAFSRLLKSTKHSEKQLGSFASRLKGLALSALIFNQISKAFNSMFSAIREGFGNLYKDVEGFRKVVDGLRASSLTLKNSFAAAFRPLVEVAIPYIQRTVDAMSGLLNVMAQFTAAITGQKTYTKAVKQTTAALEEENEAQNNQLGSLDKLNNLSSSGKAGDSGSSGLMFEEAPITGGIAGVYQDIKKLVEEKDWEGIGIYIAKRLNVGLQKIYDTLNSNRIKGKISDFASSITGAFNGLVNGFNWDEFGKVIGAGINTVVSTMEGLISGTDWNGLGSGLANWMNGIVGELDFENLGNLIGQKFMVLPGILLGFVSNLQWGEIGTQIGNALNGVVSAISLSEIGEMLGRGLTGVFQAAISFSATFDWEAFGTNIYQGVNSFFESTDWAMVGQGISDFILGLLDALIIAVEGTDWQKIGENIKVLVSNIDWAGLAERLAEGIGAVLGGLAGLLWGIIGDAWDDVVAWWNKAAYKDGKFTMKGLLDGVWEGIKNIGRWIYNHIFKPFVDGFKKAFGLDGSPVMEGLGADIMEGLLDGIGSLVSIVLEVVGGVVDGVIKVFGGIVTFVAGIFTGDWEKAWNGIVKIFEGIGDGIAAVVKGIVDGIKWVLEQIGILNTETEKVGYHTGGAFAQSSSGGKHPLIPKPKIPGYATGQVIPRSMRQHLAILGDNNQETEVVSPLSTIKQALREEAVSLGLTGGAGGTQELTIHIPVQINGRTLLDIMKQLDLEEYRRTGRPTFQV